MTETIFTCKKGCCKLKYIKYINRERDYKITRDKAGVIIYDKYNDKILLVQSKGNLWGPPKGTFENGENSVNCAKRELKEETGIDIDEDILKNAHTFRIYNSTYFFIEKRECELYIQNKEKNDANGLGWIKIACLADMIEYSLIKVNMHCKSILERCFNIILIFKDQNL